MIQIYNIVIKKKYNLFFFSECDNFSISHEDLDIYNECLGRVEAIATSQLTKKIILTLGILIGVLIGIILFVIIMKKTCGRKKNLKHLEAKVELMNNPKNTTHENDYL